MAEDKTNWHAAKERQREQLTDPERHSDLYDKSSPHHEAAKRDYANNFKQYNPDKPLPEHVRD